MPQEIRSPLSQSGILYVWRQLAQRAGIFFPTDALTGFEELGIPIYYGKPEHAQFNMPGLIVRRCADLAWWEILSAREKSLRWLPVREMLPAGVPVLFDDDIPILFWGEGYETGEAPFAERRADGTVVFNVDILAASFFMLSRWEETVVPTRDQHNRFPASNSVAYKQGFLDYPIVDYYALILREWIKTILPDWEPISGGFHVEITHDIDHIYKFKEWRGFINTVFWALKKRNWNKFKQTVQDFYFDMFAPLKGVNGRSILDLASASEKYGLASKFFFMACAPQKFQDGYDPSAKWLRDVFSKLRSAGHEIGLHAGYVTLNNTALLIKEKSELEKALGEKVYKIRFHYLRFHSPESWQSAEQAGFTYDFTMGHASHEGFRSGTCHAYHPFDIKQDRELNILETSLIAMDVTFMSYRSTPPEEAAECIIQLANRCLKVGGTFTLLWHNTSLGNAAWDKCYFEVLGKLADMQRSK